MVVQAYILVQTNVGKAADAFAVSGNRVAFLAPEAQQGADLNDDGDTTDRVVHVYELRDEQIVRATLGYKSKAEAIEAVGPSAQDAHAD